MSNNTSIVIITYNRPQEIKKFCEILEHQNFKGHLVVCDASVDESLSLNTDVLAGNWGYKTQYLHTPKGATDTVTNSMNDCFTAGLTNLKTKYFVMTCDDDIPRVDALTEFEKVLDNNKQFDACIGNILWHSQAGTRLKSIFPFTKWSSQVLNFSFLSMKRFDIIKPFDLLDENPAQRINTYLKAGPHFHTLFTFQRSEKAFQIINPNHRDIKFPHLSADYFWMLSILARAKIKYVPLDYVDRFYHGANLSEKNGNHPFPEIIEGITDTNWSSDLDKFWQALKGVEGVKCEKKLMDSDRGDILGGYVKNRLELRHLFSKNKFNEKIIRSIKRLYRLKVLFIKSQSKTNYWNIHNMYFDGEAND
jgi:glycosyltransferase domain-containing protein